MKFDDVVDQEITILIKKHKKLNELVFWDTIKREDGKVRWFLATLDKDSGDDANDLMDEIFTTCHRIRNACFNNKLTNVNKPYVYRIKSFWFSEIVKLLVDRRNHDPQKVVTHTQKGLNADGSLACGFTIYIEDKHWKDLPKRHAKHWKELGYKKMQGYINDACALSPITLTNRIIEHYIKK